MSDLSPEAILNNRYRIVNKLGQGGMGAVYLAYDLSLEHQVAVKVNHNTSADSITQFLREARLLANLRHPNLPRVIDYFIFGQEQYLVMDYIPGDDLSVRLKSEGAQPVDRVIQWADELGSAVAYLHRQNPPVIHRDIKPANIKLTLEDEPILVDFGIAKSADANQATATGAVGYTPGYAPPEQYTGSARTGPYSDQYALAATLYALLSGQKPEDGVQRVLGRAVLVPLRSLMPAVPVEVEFAIHKAMSIKPDDRFTDVKEFLQALKDPAYPAAHPSNTNPPPVASKPGPPPDSQTTPPLNNPAANPTLAAITAVSATKPGAGVGLPASASTQTEARPVGSLPVTARPAPVIGAAGSARPFPWLMAGLGAGGFILVAVLVLLVIFLFLIPSMNKNSGANQVILTSQPGQTRTSIATLTNLPQVQAVSLTPVIEKPTQTSPPTSQRTAAIALSPTLAPVTATISTETQVLTATPARVLMGGGKRVAFVSDQADGKTLQIWTMTLAISPLSAISPVDFKQLTTGPGDKTQPGWSPDGANLMYVANGSPKNGADIWVMDASGAHVHDVTNYPGNESDPSWSPDGKWIAFTNQRSSDGVKQVYIIGADGTNLTRISTDQIESQPFWSKDMKWLLNVIFASDNNYLRMRDTASGYKGTPVPFDIFTVFGRLGQVANPVFSPDGSQIAYTRVDSPTSSRVCIVDYATRGANVVIISTVNKDREPTWSPDGKWLLFTTTRDGNPELYIMNTAGKLVSRLTNLPGKDMQASWQP